MKSYLRYVKEVYSSEQPRPHGGHLKQHIPVAYRLRSSGFIVCITYSGSILAAKLNFRISYQICERERDVFSEAGRGGRNVHEQKTPIDCTRFPYL